MGFPIRRSPDQSLLTAPRGLSQRATSFIASMRQGIHQTPFRHSRDIRTLRPCTGTTEPEEPDPKNLMHRRVGGPVPVRLEPSRRLAPTQQRTTCLLQPAVPAIRADLLVRISLQLAEMSRSRIERTRHHADTGRHVQVPAALISPSSPCQAAPMIAERSIRAIHRDRV